MKVIITASISEKANVLYKKFKSKGINLSYHVEQLILTLAKENKIK